KVVVELCTAQGNVGRSATIFQNALPGTAARGGGIYSTGPMVITDSTIRNNLAVGGRGGDGLDGGVNNAELSAAAGPATGGGSFNSSRRTMTRSVVYGNEARGGRGGDGSDQLVVPGRAGSEGGSATGGGLTLAEGSGPVVIINSTISGNTVRGGVGGSGGSGG